MTPLSQAAVTVLHSLTRVVTLEETRSAALTMQRPPRGKRRHQRGKLNWGRQRCSWGSLPLCNNRGTGTSCPWKAAGKVGAGAADRDRGR